MINVGDEAIRVEQLRSKQIQAAMINPPISVMMKREGFGLLLDAADYVDLPLTGLGATLKKLKENPDQAKRVVRALNESLHFIRANRKETIAIFARWLRLDPGIAADTYDVAVKVLSADGTASDKAIVASIEEAKAAAKIKGNFTPRDVSDFSLARSVIAESKKNK
jgi:ABC-type nitrate/sulfonate/bicarbonate transport system substrate-binding protein